jgi:hypothetical protein
MPAQGCGSIVMHYNKSMCGRASGARWLVSITLQLGECLTLGVPASEAKDADHVNCIKQQSTPQSSLTLSSQASRHSSSTQFVQHAGSHATQHVTCSNASSNTAHPQLLGQPPPLLHKVGVLHFLTLHTRQRLNPGGVIPKKQIELTKEGTKPGQGQGTGSRSADTVAFVAFAV